MRKGNSGKVSLADESSPGPIQLRGQRIVPVRTPSGWWAIANNRSGFPELVESDSYGGLLAGILEVGRRLPLRGLGFNTKKHPVTKGN